MALHFSADTFASRGTALIRVLREVSAYIGGGKSAGLGAGTLRASVQDRQTTTHIPVVLQEGSWQHLTLLSCAFSKKTLGARHNTCAGRQLVPRQRRESSSSTPLMCREIGPGGLILLLREGGGTAGQHRRVHQSTAGAGGGKRLLWFVAPLFPLWKKLPFYLAV